MRIDDTPLPLPGRLPDDLSDTLPPGAEDRFVAALSRVEGKLDRILTHLGLPIDEPARANGHASE